MADLYPITARNRVHFWNAIAERKCVYVHRTAESAICYTCHIPITALRSDVLIQRVPRDALYIMSMLAQRKNAFACG